MDEYSWEAKKYRRLCKDIGLTFHLELVNLLDLTELESVLDRLHKTYGWCYCGRPCDH